MKKITILLIITILLVGCTNDKELPKTDATIFKEEYEKLNNKKSNSGDNYYRNLEIDENNPFIYKEANDIIKMIDNKETFAIYFGFASCPWCRSVIPSLIEVSNDLGIAPIYYVDVKEIRDVKELNEKGEVITKKEGTKDYYKLLEKLNSVLENYTITTEEGKEIETGVKRIYAPNIVAVVDGVATKMTTGISNQQENAYMELTTEMKKDSYDKIKCTIECINDKKEVCSLNQAC